MNPLNQNLLLNERLSKLETKLILIDHGLCPDWIRPEHTRMRDTMYLILDGKGKITVNGTTLYPRRNDLVLLPRNSRVSLYAKSESCYNKYWCDFMMNLEEHSLFELIDIPYLVHLEEISYAKSLFDRLEELHLKTDLISAFTMKTALLQLVTLLLENANSPASNIKSDHFAREINAWMAERLTQKFSVKSLADHMGFNEKYFISLFKKHFHTTPAQYIKQRRLEQAKYELLYTNDKAAQIIEKIGYSTVQKFSADFRDYTGYTPLQFKRTFR